MPRPNKSDAIRKVLEADPEVRPAHAQAILAKDGIDISLDLFRVVKMNWLRDRQEQEESERKYKEYWSPEAVERRVAERVRRQQELDAHRRRMEEYEARLWEYYKARMSNPSGPWPELPARPTGDEDDNPRPMLVEFLIRNLDPGGKEPPDRNAPNPAATCRPTS